jgi:AraC-like DNA-binding protein
MSSVFHLSYVDPPPALARHVLALFHFVWDEREIADRHPGALSQIALFPYGKGILHSDQGIQEVNGEAHLLAGFDRALPFTMEGPWHAIGASLSPLGWAALTGLPANRHFNRFADPVSLLGEDIGDFASASNALYRSGALSGEDAILRLADWLAPRFAPLSAAHEKLIEDVLAWLGSSLNPEIGDLHRKVSYSQRQTERLVARFFGLPPTALARKFRAIRAARILSEETIGDEAEAEIGDAFYDQSHMIREIRRYCGYTPTRLGGEGEPLFQTMLKLKNLDRLGIRTID